ncbi:MAG: hypothetical protein HC889_11435 [Synechococcaceae cyanobacterium SM1_2_3]|nr:hypothetical protein [Synechococcaceae cyanobacterium SM1_2_3]
MLQDNRIVFRDDFDRERRDLLDQVPILRRYADYMLKYSPTLIGALTQAASQVKAGLVVTHNPNAGRLSRLQLPILNDYVDKTAGDAQQFCGIYSDLKGVSINLSTTFSRVQGRCYY